MNTTDTAGALPGIGTDPALTAAEEAAQKTATPPKDTSSSGWAALELGGEIVEGCATVVGGCVAIVGGIFSIFSD